MATSGFGSAPQEEPREQTGSGHGPNGSAGQGIDAVAETFDINDPRLISEPLEVNLEADSYAMPEPLPDGRWRAKLKVMKPLENGKEVDLGFIVKKHERSGQLYLSTGLEATTVSTSEKLNGLKAFDSWVSTFIGKDGGSKISTILTRLKRPDGKLWAEPGSRYTHRAWMDLFIKAMAGEPELGIESQWEWSCQACGEAAAKAGERYPRSVNGMHKFPVNPKTKHYDPEMKCQVNPAHGYSRARVRISAVLPLSEVK